MAEHKGSINIGLNGSTLKIIAIISMIIDHTGAALWRRLPEMGYLVPDILSYDKWYFFYRCMRNIGRTAFPIFCFLLVEGFFNTSNKRKYAIRLLLFAFLSQLPFHYAFLNVISGRNVFYTLFLGFITILGIDKAEYYLKQQYIFKNLLKILIMAAGAGLAAVLNTDYGWKGIMLIGIFYLFREQRLLALVIGYLSFLWEWLCFPAFLLLGFYNGKRGIRLKMLFYLIYPLHLSVLYVIWRYLL